MFLCYVRQLRFLCRRIILITLSISSCQLVIKTNNLAAVTFKRKKVTVIRISSAAERHGTYTDRSRSERHVRFQKMLGEWARSR